MAPVGPTMPPVRRRAQLASIVSLVILFGLLAALAARPAFGDPAEVDRLIDLIRTKPSGMDRDTWKEKRRDAARKLGRLGDRRAVPVLIEVVETEDFDAIAEIAIEALGKLGDDSAVPALQAVYADKSRDRYVRNLAAKSLEQLGAEPEGGLDDDDDQGAGAGKVVTPPVGGGEKTAPTSAPPATGDDILASTEHLTFAAGALSFQYDTLQDRPALDGNLAASYQRTVDRPSWAYRYGAGADAAGGVLDYDGDDNSSRYATLQTHGTADARFYLRGRPLYALVESALGVEISSVRINRPGPDNTTHELLFGADLHAGLGAGYGRVIDVGAGLRLRRLEQVLERGKVLGRPINPQLAERVLRAWWRLRGEVSGYSQLVETVALLREAGVLLGEPDAGTSYELLQVLTDGQLDHRLRGYDVNLALAESYLIRDDVLPVEDGRIESVLLHARYGHQSPTGSDELLGEASLRYRILAEDTDPTPWAAAATAAWRHYRYGSHFDPLGALEIAGEVAAANDDAPTAAGETTKMATRVAGRLGWIFTFNRASTVRASASLAIESGEWFLGLGIEGTYGLLDVGFLGASTYNSLRGHSTASE